MLTKEIDKDKVIAKFLEKFENIAKAYLFLLDGSLPAALLQRKLSDKVLH